MNQGHDTVAASLSRFRQLCSDLGLAVTHQRAVIYQTLRDLPGHPSPDQVFEKVRMVIPEISVATVYKTLHTFVEKGLLQEVSPLRASMRMEIRDDPHHHLICRSCQSITDIEESEFGRLALPDSLPHGFRPEKLRIEIVGLCDDCADSSPDPNTP